MERTETYYSMIGRAIRYLGHNPSDEARRKVYDRARDALQRQLDSARPVLLKADLEKEMLALEEAIWRLEKEEQEIRAHNLERSQSREEAVSHRATPDGLSGSDIDRVLSREKIPLPPITAIPEQNDKAAIGFRISRRGVLDLSPDASSDQHDPEQSQLYSRIRRQLEKLKEDIPSQERAQIDGELNDFLDQPASWHEVEFKKVLWLCGNALRNILAQHDAARLSPEPHYSSLPPSVAEALRRPVEGWNVFVLGDADLAELDAKRLGPQEQEEALRRLNAAQPILEPAAEDRQLTTKRAGTVLTATLKVAADTNTNINTRQAQDLAEGTTRNFIVQLIRRAYLFCQDIIDPQTEEARALSSEYRKGAAKAAGATTFAGIVAATTYGAPYAVSFFEFVAANAGLLKQYVAVAFQNNQLAEIIDAIKYTKERLRD